jgi:hypothetical protein
MKKFLCIYYDGDNFQAKIIEWQDPYGLTPEMIGLTSNDSINALIEVDYEVCGVSNIDQTDDPYIIVFKGEHNLSTVRTLELDRAEQEALDNS